jgi:hypothetical protein
MTDFESQLRECLTRHADRAEAPLGLLSATRARSRQLSRRRNTATVAAVVPVTAAVVLGAVAASGTLSSSAGPSNEVQPGTSSSPSTSPSVTTTPIPGYPTAQPACAGGTVPNVVFTGNDQQSIPVKPHTVSVNLPVLTGLAHRVHSVVQFSVLNSTQFMVSGAAPATDQDLIEVVVRNKDHSLSRLWFSELRGATVNTTADATFLSCSAVSSS